MSIEDPLAGSERDSGFCLPCRYRVLGVLGRGAMSVVYLASDDRLQRQVAIKVLSHLQDGQLRRFRREALLAARLKAPGIVKVHELGECAGRPFIAMQHVDGGNLAGARLGPRELARVLRDVAESLQHAHERGVIHRDIKPENILLDREGRAYVTDFGLARDLCAGEAAALSVEGQLLGTPASMAPEQVRGDRQAVGPRTDVYSLGATLFFELTGRWPFEGSTVVDVLHAVLHQPSPSPRAFDPGLPKALDAVVTRCLEKEPEARYPSMAAVAEDLDRFLAARARPARSWLGRVLRGTRRPGSEMRCVR